VQACKRASVGGVGGVGGLGHKKDGNGRASEEMASLLSGPSNAIPAQDRAVQSIHVSGAEGQEG
jgi:hypothetical protein